MIKFINTILILIGLTLVLLSAPVYAFDSFKGVNCLDPNNNSSAVCSDKNRGSTNPISGPDGVIIKIANLISYVAGIAAIIFLVIAGINYAASSGDSSKVNNARRTIIYTLIGVFVIAIARLLVGIILEVIR